MQYNAQGINDLEHFIKHNKCIFRLVMDNIDLMYFDNRDSQNNVLCTKRHMYVEAEDKL